MEIQRTYDLTQTRTTSSATQRSSRVTVKYGVSYEEPITKPNKSGICGDSRRSIIDDDTLLPGDRYDRAVE